MTKKRQTQTTQTPMVQVDGDKLAEAIRRVSPFTARSTHVLSGIFFEFDQGILQLTATDGYCMAHFSVELPFLEGARVLEGEGCKDFANRHYNGQAVEVKVEGDTVKMGDVEVENIQGDYPNYNSLRPADPDTFVIIDPKVWIKPIRKNHPDYIGVVYSNQGCRMYFQVKGETIDSEQVAAQMFDGPEKKIAYQGEQFRKALTNCGPSVTIKVGLPDKATLFEGDGYWHLLMPHDSFPRTSFLTKQEKEVISWAEEALASVRRGEAPGKVMIGGGKFYLELSTDCTETEVLNEEPILSLGA